MTEIKAKDIPFVCSELGFFRTVLFIVLGILKVNGGDV